MVTRLTGLPTLSALFQFVQRNLRIAGRADHSDVLVLSDRSRDSSGRRGQLRMGKQRSYLRLESVRNLAADLLPSVLNKGLDLILQWSEIDAFTRPLLIQTRPLFDSAKEQFRHGRDRDPLARALLNPSVQLYFGFEERMVQEYVVDNSVGIADFVVAGPDWRNRRQLNTFVVSGRAGRVDYPTDYWSASRSLVTR